MENNKLVKIWNNFITANTNDFDRRNVLRVDQDFSELRRIIFLNSLSLIGIIFALSLSIISFYTNNFFELYARLILVVFCIINIILIRVQKSTNFSAYLLHFFVAAGLIYQIQTSTFGLISLLGYFVFCYLSFFIIDRRVSIIFNSLFLLILIFLSIGKNLSFDFKSSPILFAEVIIFFLFMLGINYILRSLEDKNEEMLIESRMELSASFSSMIAEIDKSKQLESKLKVLLAESSKNNQKLEKAQKAMVNVLEDLETEKDQIEKRRANDEAILSSVGEGLVVISKNQEIKLINKAFESILGFTEEEVIGKNFFDIVTIFDEKTNVLEPKSTAIYKTLTTGESSINIIRYFKRKDGSLVPVGLNISPITLDGEVIGAVEVMRDITKELEIDKAKTEFVSLASHQLKTPLAAINWYSEILLSGDSGELNENQLDYIKEIADGGRRMTDLVTALLNVSRIDLGTFAVDPELLDLTKISNSVIKELEQQIELKQIEVVKDYQKALPEIMADPKLIRIVLQNLISNAVKYTPDKGKVIVEIFTDNNFMNINVKDTGYGIPEKQQSKIFTKLFRADNVVDKVTDGTGLGLYIVKSIIEDSEGKIWFESKEGKGTSFFVQLPLSGMKKKTGTRQLS